LFAVNNVQDAEDEFGSDSPLMKPLHEALEQGADNIAVMRIGGKRGHVTIKTTQDGISYECVITPELRDAEALSRYSLIADNGRLYIYDTRSEIFVFDSEEEVVLDTGLVDVQGDWAPGLTLGSLADLAVAPLLSSIEVDGDQVTDVTPVDGDDGMTMSKLELYHALEQAYQFIDYEDADILIPVGVYSNDLNQADEGRGSASVDFSTFVQNGMFVPVAGSSDDALGYLWKVLYRGKPYCVFFEQEKPIADGFADGDLSTEFGPVASNLTMQPADGFGDLGSVFAFQLKDAEPGKPSSAALSLGSDNSILLTCSVDLATHNSWPDVQTELESLALFGKMFKITSALETDQAAIDAATARRNGAQEVRTALDGAAVVSLVKAEEAAQSVVDAIPPAEVARLEGATAAKNAIDALDPVNPANDGDDVIAAKAAADVKVADYEAEILAANLQPGERDAKKVLANGVASDRVILTHTLDGESMPASMLLRLLECDDAEVRHVNFAHQLAYAAYRASTTWSTMLGIISVKSPERYSRAAIAEWAGQEPAYSFTGTDLSVATAAANGEGVLASMFHAGKYGYRSANIKTGSVADEGYAYGGYILTEGATLPTAEPYGISDGDEALDAKGKPIDLGKHILVCASWPIHSNSFDGGAQYRGSLCGSLAGKIAVTPEKEEPIGSNGVVPGLRRPPRMRTPLVDSLAKLRFVSTRREEGTGHILVSVKTAAHPDSDYARLSTIRCVNRQIAGLRRICKPIIGKEFSQTRLASLQTAINGFLKAEKEAGYNQGAIATLSYTRADRIMGKLKIRLKMIPPFSIEAITVETTLASEESELVL